MADQYLLQMGDLTNPSTNATDGTPWRSELAQYCRVILQNTGWYMSGIADRVSAAAPPVNSLLFTGPIPQLGVTTLAVTTAIVAAEDRLSRVLLVDCSAEGEATDLLGGRGEPADLDIWLARNICKTDIRNLHVLPLESVSEYRHVKRMKTAIEQLKRCFDLVVIDMPAGYSARWRDLLLASSELALVVVNQSCSQHLVNRLSRQLHEAGTGQAGIIVNMDEHYRNPAD